jgi:hypothetical protein
MLTPCLQPTGRPYTRSRLSCGKAIRVIATYLHLYSRCTGVLQCAERQWRCNFEQAKVTQESDR